MNKNLLNLSPLDGRYANDLIDLNSFFSEMSLIQYRIKIEVEYLIALSNEKKIQHIATSQKIDARNKIVFPGLINMHCIGADSVF